MMQSEDYFVTSDRNKTKQPNKDGLCTKNAETHVCFDCFDFPFKLDGKVAFIFRLDGKVAFIEPFTVRFGKASDDRQTHKIESEMFVYLDLNTSYSNRSENNTFNRRFKVARFGN
jgi:hypothetical protein